MFKLAKVYLLFTAYIMHDSRKTAFQIFIAVGFDGCTDGLSIGGLLFIRFWSRLF